MMLYPGGMSVVNSMWRQNIQFKDSHCMPPFLPPISYIMKRETRETVG